MLLFFSNFKSCAVWSFHISLWNDWNNISPQFKQKFINTQKKNLDVKVACHSACFASYDKP